MHYIGFLIGLMISVGFFFYMKSLMEKYIEKE